MSNHDLEEILRRNSEAADLDFKSSFDPKQDGEWLEVIKDIVALANTGGGTILLGANNDGSPSGFNITLVESVDPADVTNKLFKYTGTNFDNFEIKKCEKSGSEMCAIRIGATRIPIVFTKVGTHEVTPGRQKTAFSAGTVYFRHGAKSEPGTSDDLRVFLEREVEIIRHSWLDGIKKVVDAPSGSRIAVLPPGSQPIEFHGAIPIRLVNDQGAPEYRHIPRDESHPHRAKEIVAEVNQRLEGKRAINSHDILCIRKSFPIDTDPNLCEQDRHGSPRYTQGFVDWIVTRFSADGSFFDKCRAQVDRPKAKE